MEKIMKFDNIYDNDYNLNTLQYNMMECESLKTNTVLDNKLDILLDRFINSIDE